MIVDQEITNVTLAGSCERVSLQLPQRVLRTVLASTLSFYGADLVVQNYCDVAESLPERFSWQHGWCSKDRQEIDPLLLVKEPKIDPEKCYLVARQDEADYLASRGLNSVAIGLPFVYAEAYDVQRIPRSLLVMPAHSLAYTTHQWKFDRYVESILEIRDKFDVVVACIHPACSEKGYWQPQFEQAGIDCVIGADAHDENGLVRVKMLLSQFEFMTTNTLGSHVVYGWASGNRVSIFGDYAEYQNEDFAHSEYYQLNPHLLEPILRLHREAYVRQTLPELFCHPSDAVTNSEWAKRQVGFGQKKSVAQLKRVFEWTLFNQFKKIKKSGRSLSRKILKGPEAWIKRRIRQ